MSNRKKLYLLISILFSPLYSLSQEYSIKKIGKDDGLPNQLVYCTIIDDSGRVWCSTEGGLAVYNGDGFVPIVNYSHDSNSIVHGLVYTLCKDRSGRIWCGTYRSGITIIDPNNNQYKHLNILTHPDIFKDAVINSIQNFNSDTLIINSSMGSHLIDINNLNSYRMDGENNIMKVNVGDSTFILRENSSVAAYYRGQLLYKIKAAVGQTLSMRIDNINSDKYVSTYNGVYSLLYKSSKRIKIVYEGVDISTSKFNGVLIDNHKNYFLNSLTYGLLKVTSRIGNHWRCVSLSKKKWYKKGNSLYSNYYVSNNNFFFVGTQLGLFQINKVERNIREVRNPNLGTIKAIYCNKDNLYLGTEDGIFTGQDSPTGNTNRLVEKKKRKNSLFINQIIQKSNGLFAYGSGEYILNVNEAIEVLPEKNNLYSEENIILSTELLNSNQLIIGNYSGKAIILDNENNVKKEFNLELSEPVYQPLVQINDSIVVLKTFSYLLEFNIRTGMTNKISSISNFMITDFLLDSKKLYLASTKGLFIYNERYELIEKIDLEESGVESQVNSIIVKDSLIWFANSTGIGFVNMNNRKITFLESGDAFETTNFAYASKFDGGDSIYFGGENGVVIINTKKIHELKQDFNAFIMLPAVYRDGKRFSLTSDQEKDLRYNQNNLEYQIVHTNYKYPSSVRFQYRLNKDLPWIQADKSGLLKLYNLPPDDYNLQVRDQNTDEIVASRKFTINPPWYQTWWFRILLMLAILVNVFYMTRLYYRRRIIAQQKEIEKQKSIRKERERISRDLHDDIGSGLSAVKLQAEYLEALPKEEWTKENLHDIVDESQELTTSMREIVWSLNTQYDNLQDFVQYIRRYAVQYFDKSSIKLQIDAPMEVDDIELNGLVRRNIFLVYKEALHNVLKHSEASQVDVQIKVTSKLLQISIDDNGRGFDVNESNGNGLQSMQYRMNAVNGTYDITSSDKGTNTTFSIKL